MRVVRDPGGSEDNPSTLPARVLIAEDEHLVATDLAKQVKSLSIDVIGPAARGQEAIDLAREQKPDMALLDIRMPNGSGLDAAKVLQEDLGIPVILVSAYSDGDYVDRGVELGVFGYLLKPVSADQLRVSLAVAWAAYRQRKELGDEVDGLKTALADRKIIERAKGLLIDQLQVPEAEAMRMLQRHARNTRRRLAEVAAAVIEDNEILATGGLPDDKSR